MLFKKIINIIALLLFISFSSYFVIKTGNSISVLNNISVFNSANEAVNTSHLSTTVRINPPIIIDNNLVYFQSQIESSSEIKQSLAYFNLDNFQIKTIYDFEKTNNQIIGFAKDDNKKLFLVNNTEDSKVLTIEKDTVFKNLSESIPVKKQKIKSLAIVRSNAEIVAIDSLQEKYIRYIYRSNEKNWEERAVRDNPFFSRISKPLTAYYNNAWHFITISRYHLKDGLFVFTPSGTSNLMHFRYDYSNHIEDIIVPIVIDSLKFSIDKTLSGIIETIDCKTTINIFNQKNSSLKHYDCLDKNNNVSQIFQAENSNLKRLIQLNYSSANSLKLSTEIGKNLKTISQSHNPNSRFTEYIYNEEIFAKSKNNISDIYIIPYNNSYLLLTSNSEYCVLDSELKRTDSFGFFKKVKNGLLNFYQNFIQNPADLKNLCLIGIISLYPIFVFISFFLFFTIKIFFTTKRPYYSKRRSNSHKYYSYLFFASIIYILSFSFFILNITDLIKTL